MFHSDEWLWKPEPLSPKGTGHSGWMLVLGQAVSRCAISVSCVDLPIMTWGGRYQLFLIGVNWKILGLGV